MYVKFQLKKKTNRFFYRILKLSLFEGEQKHTVFVSVPLKKLLL